ncbi:MAG: hypothetical protein ACNS63_03785 [Candidatus Nitrospinota bacterium M3_3B_026]
MTARRSGMAGRALIILFLTAAPVSAFAADNDFDAAAEKRSAWSWSLKLEGGALGLSSGDWAPVEGRTVFGLSGAVGKGDWRFVAGYSQAAKAAGSVSATAAKDGQGWAIQRGYDISSSFSEIRFGPGWGREIHPPFFIDLSAGAALVSMSLDASSQGRSSGASGSAAGAFVALEAGARVYGGFLIGAGARAVMGARMDIAGQSVSADYMSFGVFAGYAW